MNVNRIYPLADVDALTGLRNFLSTWWTVYQPHAMFAPLELEGVPGPGAQEITDPDDLKRVNPFAPLMPRNAAIQARQFIRAHPGERLVLMLRPCELRTYIEQEKRESLAAGAAEVVLIGVDCLGTYSKDEYHRRVDAAGTLQVTDEVLRNASQGGWKSLPFRTACQVCDWGAPRGADIAIGIIGVETDKHLLVILHDEGSDRHLKMGAVAGDLASEYQVSHRETVVGAIADTHAGMRRVLLEEMQERCGFNDIGCLLAWFASCNLCGNCLAACPFCQSESAVRRVERGEGLLSLSDLVDISRRLTSCSGCGMCEESCVNHVPMALIFSALSHRIRDEIHYHAGDPTQKLPWTVSRSVE
jgi:formate dehydrogenase subunit beta